MNSIFSFFNISKEHVSKVNMQLIIFVLNLIIAFISYYRYDTMGKRKYKKFQVEDHEITSLKSLIYCLALIPIIVVYLDYLKLELFPEVLMRFDIQGLIIFLLLLYLFFDHIRKFRQYNNNSSRNGIIKSLNNIFISIIVPVLIMILALIVTLFLHELSHKFIYNIIKKTNIGVSYYINIMTMYIIGYVLNLVPLILFFIFKKKSLEKSVKEVKVFYKQNGVLKVGYNIDYKDFSISREFISFYSKTEKCRSVVPNSDLAKIQYHYYD